MFHMKLELCYLDHDCVCARMFIPCNKETYFFRNRLNSCNWDISMQFVYIHKISLHFAIRKTEILLYDHFFSMGWRKFIIYYYNELIYSIREYPRIMWKCKNLRYISVIRRAKCMLSKINTKSLEFFLKCLVYGLIINHVLL
jgi:hypothetical protein